MLKAVHAEAFPQAAVQKHFYINELVQLRSFWTYKLKEKKKERNLQAENVTPATHMTLEFKGIDDEDDLKRIDNLWVWLQSLPFSDLVSSWTGNKLCLHKNTNDYVQYVMCTCDNISVFILAFIRSNDKRISPKYAELI